MGSAWNYKAGEKGRNRVRAFEKGNSGKLYLEFYERDPETGDRHRRRISTGHRNRERAKRQADRLAAEFADVAPERTPGTTLRELFDNYLDKRSPQVGERQRKHHHRCKEMFCRYLGPDCDAESLNRRDWDSFRQDRTTGVIDARGRKVPGKERQPVAARTVKRDMQALRAALNWAVQADLLDHNPCAQYPYPSTGNQHRPRVSQERYEAMLEVASDVDWRFDLALILAHETGHRIRAIRHLKWSDVDLSAGLIRWRGEEDKTGNEHVTPLTDAAREGLQSAQQVCAAIGETWVLPSPTDPSGPVSRHLLRDWWYRAEELAELGHIKGLGWHGLRRKFADDLRDVPLKDLADLGGWATPRTILEVYQDSDLGAMRRALENRNAVREGAGGG